MAGRRRISFFSRHNASLRHSPGAYTESVVPSPDSVPEPYTIAKGCGCSSTNCKPKFTPSKAANCLSDSHLRSPAQACPATLVTVRPGASNCPMFEMVCRYGNRRIIYYPLLSSVLLRSRTAVHGEQYHIVSGVCPSPLISTELSHILYAVAPHRQVYHLPDHCVPKSPHSGLSCKLNFTCTHVARPKSYLCRPYAWQQEQD